MSKRVYQIIIAILSIALLVSCLRTPTKPRWNSEGSNTSVSSSNNYGSNKAQRNNAGAVNDANNNKSGAQGVSSEMIALSSLPAEGQAVLKKIQNRESFPYRQDGQVFSNREGVLPSKRGYYQEYTVPTPGADNRGARRIVSGQGSTGDAATSGEYYYTSDHYRSFARIRLQ